jgi:predicted membrane channel-forming protein YqfA (hemolysin III family)
MRLAILASGFLSIALWMTIKDQAFASSPGWAWFATFVLLGWGAVGIFSTLWRRPPSAD